MNLKFNHHDNVKKIINVCFSLILFNSIGFCLFLNPLHHILLTSVIFMYSFGTTLYISYKRNFEPFTAYSIALLLNSIVICVELISSWERIGLLLIALWGLNASFYYVYKKIQNHLNFLFSKQKEESNFNKAIYYTASNLSNTTNPDIDDILKNICAYTGLDRISIYILDDHNIKLDKSLNLTTQKNDLPNLITLDETTLNSLKIIKEVFIHDEHGNTPIINLLKSNIKHSFVYIPILSQNNDFFGFFLFESIDKPKIWDYENFKILKILSYSYSSFIGRKRAEELAEHTAKLSALGEISAGIAHEINNPLAIIHGQSNILKFLIEDAKKSGTPISIEDLQETNNLLLETVERTDKILNGLRYFVRNDENNPFVKTDIDNILDTVQILSIDRCKKSGIIVSLDRGNVPNLFELECKPTQLAQVIINLINNSFDAINLLDKSNEKWIKIKTELKNDMLHISVIDSGNGISKEMGDKILQKFYTTKKYSKFSGSGIGLNISKRIVEMHHGTMTIDYTHQNTKFDVVLPLTQPI